MSKRILAVVLSVCLLLSTMSGLTISASADAWDGTVATSFTGGSGTEADPYQIATGAQLAYLASLVNSGTNMSGVYYVLTTDIDLGSQAWTPIGTSSARFEGTFDGKGYTISNLYIYYDIRIDEVSDQGLFGYVGTTGTVKNVEVNGTVTAYNCVGGIIGINRGIVSNCSYSGSVSGKYYVGGVVGFNYGTVEECCSRGTFSGTMQRIGGITGAVENGKVQNCYSSCSVSSGSVYSTIGGIVGQVNSSTVQNCYCLSSTSFSAVGVIDSGTVTSTASVTTDEFASGEVAYLLNNGVTNGTQVWYQTIGTDAYPVFDNTHMTVYAGTDCKGVAVYGNTQFTGTVHTYGDPSWSWTGYTSATATFTCTICNNYTETVNASITDATTSASCTDDGKIIYTASVTFNGTTYTNKQTVGLVATGHSYTVTACDWSSDYTSATLTLTCDNCSDEQPVVATEIESEVTTAAQCEDEGAVLYTATGSYNNVEYTYSVTVASAATGHTFGMPEIVWASDNTATATVACQSCGAVQNLEVTVTSTTDSYGNTIYTATVTYNGVPYTSQQTVEAVKTTTSNSDIYTTLSRIQASYTGVQAAIAKANSLNPDDYENFSAVTEAIEAVDWTLNVLNQKLVNSYAEAIEEAIENLVPVETVDIEEETIEIVDPVEAGDTDSE